MVRDCKFGKLKTTLKRFIHLCVFFIYLFTPLAFHAQGGNAQSGLLRPHSALFVDTTLDSNEPAYQACSDQPDDCSLRGAISRANLSPEQEYLIELPPGDYNLSLSGAGEDGNASGDIDVYGRVTLAGAVAATTQISGSALDRVLQVHSSARLILKGLTVTDGQAPSGIDGGGIYNRGNLTITHSVIAQNSAGHGLPGEVGRNGGGIYNAGSLLIQDSQVEDNTAGSGNYGYQSGDGGAGGGIYNAGSLIIQDSQIKNNSAGSGGSGIGESSDGGDGGSGGAILNTRSLTIIQTTISGNVAGNGGAGADGSYYDWYFDAGNGGDGGDGGGIYSFGTLKIYESSLLNNGAGSAGSGGYGGMYCCSGYNGSGGNGGGILSFGTLRIEKSEINENFTSHGGEAGGIYSASNLIIEDSEINENKAGSGASAGRSGGRGGGIYIARGNASILRSQVNLNITGAGGGIFSSKWGVSPGGSGGDGGGIYIQQGALILDDASVIGNKAGEGGSAATGGSGGGIFNAGTLTVNSSIIQANQTGEGGEGVFDDYMLEHLSAQPGGRGGGLFSEGDLLIIYSQIDGNQTGDGGGAPDGGDVPWDCAPGGAGGGIFNQGTAQVTYSQISSNTTGNGGETEGFGNCDDGSGGGVYNSGAISLEYSSVLSNTAGNGDPSGNGGGLYSNASLFLKGVALRENHGRSGGGALLSGESNIAIHNTVIADNHGGSGSGVYANNVPLNLWHTTLARNTGGDGTGLHIVGATARMTNTILVSHTVGINAMFGSMVSLDSTMWGSGPWANLTDMSGSGSITHTHSLTGTPGFVDPDQGDYHLDANSEARDQGIHSISTTDLDNQPRPNPDTDLPDLGADEYWSPTPIAAVSITAPISGTTYANIPFTATVTPISATPNIFYVWIPTPATGQGTSTVTYFWYKAGQKTVHVTALNLYGGVQATQDITITASEFKTYMPNIYSSR